MFQVNEIKKWAKTHGVSVKKIEDLYVWFEDKNKEKTSEPATIDQVVKEIFNKITNNKFLDHQKKYKQENLDSTLR